MSESNAVSIRRAAEGFARGVDGEGGTCAYGFRSAAHKRPA